MEENKKQVEEIISKEQIESVNETVDKAATVCQEKVGDPKIDYERVKQTLNSFEGMNIHTAIAVITTAMVLLPAGAILSINKMGERAFKAKALSEILSKAKDGDLAELLGLGEGLGKTEE